MLFRSRQDTPHTCQQQDQPCFSPLSLHFLHLLHPEILQQETFVVLSALLARRIFATRQKVANFRPTNSRTSAPGRTLEMQDLAQHSLKFQSVNCNKGRNLDKEQSGSAQTERKSLRAESPKKLRVPRWCGVHSSRPVARV